MVKVHAAEAAAATRLTVDDAASAAAAAGILAVRGAAGVVVTLGIAGAVVVSAAGATFLVPPDVRGAYPVGSGDAFFAGLAAALIDGGSLEEAARRGMAAGIANALVPGACELDRAAAERLVHEIKVRAM